MKRSNKWDKPGVIDVNAVVLVGFAGLADEVKIA
jgi:hypothetical protein